MNASCTIVWFRNDIRLADHPALHSAFDRGDEIIPVYIHSTEDDGNWSAGAASRWWLHHALTDLDDRLDALKSRLTVREGKPLDVLRTLIRETGASTIVWNRRYEPAGMEYDDLVMEILRKEGVTVEQYGGNVLFEPESVQTGSGAHYQVFTPFWEACLSLPEPQKPLDPPDTLKVPCQWPRSIPLERLALRPSISWAGGIRASWKPGSAGVEKQLDRLITDIVKDYKRDRNRPDLPGTSRLSPYLHFGEVSARRIWHTVRDRAPERSGEAYLRQLGWRDFSIHMVYHVPKTTGQPLKPEFESFPWQDAPEALRAWQRARTGYPLVDAGMRELWVTGWMHNRVRMVVGSFLVKHLLIPWQAGARWFWDTLVDADLANNTMGWQWIAGCGADAAPYFRIFNPILQSKKFDTKGNYIRRWVPELASLPDDCIHTPWEASPHILEEAGIVLGETYPFPIVDHTVARDLAMKAYKHIRELRP